MQRRDFLCGAGLLATSSLLTLNTSASQLATNTWSINKGDWKALRKMFPLTYDYIHLATFLLASHPKPVADAIEKHRYEFDKNPADYWHQHFQTIDHQICQSAADYMGGTAQQVALTDSTTMGLAMVYSGIRLKPGDEILQTVHDHYSTDLSLQLRAERTGVKINRIALYESPARVNQAEILTRIKNAINENTKVLAITWVHSSTGVKLPVRAIADLLKDINNQREEQDKVLFCVDGVHGFGIENADVSKLGCDFFIAGTHKWIFGPRGTGVIWGSDYGWSRCTAVIPSFSRSYDVWLGNSEQHQVPVGEYMSPGGFHSFEHRWALPEAFKLHLQLGKDAVEKRIHELNSQTKEGLAKMSHVTLHTPVSKELSSGLVCFEVQGMVPDAVVKALHSKGIIMSSTPYRNTLARFAPSLLNNETEIETALREIAGLA